MSKHQIKYTGPSQHTRIITAKEAEGAGFVLPGDLTWGLETRHSLILEDLDETALEYFQSDPDFRVKEISSGDEEEKAKATAARSTPEKEIAEDTEGGASGGGSMTARAGRGRRTTSTTTAP
jgi:hypothetical protein